MVRSSGTGSRPFTIPAFGALMLLNSCIIVHKQNVPEAWAMPPVAEAGPECPSLSGAYDNQGLDAKGTSVRNVYGAGGSPLTTEEGWGRYSVLPSGWCARFPEHSEGTNRTGYPVGVVTEFFNRER